MGALRAVIENKAEVAPMDSYAWALLAKCAPELTAQVRVIESTEPTAIPAVVASGPAPAGVAAAFLAAGAEAATRALMDQLLLHSFARPEAEAYDALGERFLTMQAFWRQHPLARQPPPLFPPELGRP